MLYAFTDESYMDERYLQGAFVIEESQLGLLDQIVHETSEFAQQFGIAPGTELRGYSLMNSKHGWEPLREMFHARVAIYKYLLSKVAHTNGVILFVEQGSNPISVDAVTNASRHLTTQQELLKQLNGLGALRGKTISIVADEITAQHSLAFHFTRQSAVLANIDSLTFVESQKIAGIQLIDPLLYIYQRSCQENITEHRSYKVITELWDLVAHLHQK